uniref:Uncharacterized protein n=2 Tax=Ciona intestinalis TaxID=7719 RepID=F6UD27_CIOIN
MEHPSSPQPYPGGYPQQGNAYHNTDIPNNRNKDSGGYHGYSGVTVASSGGYRDDSSGYGSASTHTERSYDGQRPLGGAKPNLAQKPRLPPGGQRRTPSGPSSPPWQREFGDNKQFEYQQQQRSYNNDKQEQSYNTESQRNFQQ